MMSHTAGQRLAQQGHESDGSAFVAASMVPDGPLTLLLTGGAGAYPIVFQCFSEPIGVVATIAKRSSPAVAYGVQPAPSQDIAAQCFRTRGNHGLLFAVFSCQTSHHPDEDFYFVPSLPAAMACMMQPIDHRGIAPQLANAFKQGNRTQHASVIPFEALPRNGLLGKNRGDCRGIWGRRGQGASSFVTLPRSGQPEKFRHVHRLFSNHEARSPPEIMGPKQGASPAHRRVSPSCLQCEPATCRLRTHAKGHFRL